MEQTENIDEAFSEYPSESQEKIRNAQILCEEADTNAKSKAALFTAKSLAILPSLRETVIGHQTSFGNPRVAMRIARIPRPRPLPQPVWRAESWLEVRLEDLVTIWEVDTNSTDLAETILFVENLRTGVCGVIPAIAFIIVGPDEMCDCPAHDGTCGCAYENLAQSLANEKIRTEAANAASPTT